MSKITRFGVSVPHELVKQLDELISAKGVKHGKVACATSGRKLV